MEKRRTVMGIEYREIQITEIGRRYQVRKSVPKDRGAEIVASIKQHGVLQPLRVDASGQLILGDVQAWGARAAGQKMIAALVEDKELTEVEALCLQLSEDVQYIPLKPTEKADAFGRLMELTQYSASEAAASVGTSIATLSRLQAIAGLEEVFRELVDGGRLGVSKAYELSLMTPEDRIALLPAIKSGELTRDDLQAVRKSSLGTTGEEQTTSPTRVKVVLDGGRTVTVQAAELDMEGYIDAIGTLLRKAKRAQARGLVLGDFARAVRAEKKAASA
jgi:ParB/RepB/Spo0J family partition protein